MASKINKILTNESQEFSQEELANVSASLSAILGQGGGAPCASAWLPYVNSDGDISWRLSMTTTAPATANIMGPEGPSGSKGDPGDTPTFRINSSTNYWEVSYDDGSTWTSLDTSATGPKGDTGATGPQGPQGPSGTNGKDGTNGYSIELQSVTDEDGGKKVTLSWGATPSTSSFVIPSGAKGANGQDGAPGANGISPTFTVTQITSGHSVTISGAQGSTTFNVLDGADGKDGDDGFSPTMSFTEAATSVDHENGGTIVTFTYGASGSQTAAYTAWNGNNGSGGGGSTYTAGEGIDIDNDVISFSGAQVDTSYTGTLPKLEGNGTIESPLSMSGFSNAVESMLNTFNSSLTTLSDELQALGGTITLKGEDTCNNIGNIMNQSSTKIGDAYIATDSGQVWGKSVNKGDLVVKNTSTVSILTTAPDMSIYAKLTQRSIIEAGLGATITRTVNSDGANVYTVNVIPGGEGTTSAYNVNSTDDRFVFDKSIDSQTGVINYSLSADLPKLINVASMQGITPEPNSYYFVIE